MNENLMRAIIESAKFLALSPEDVVDPDTAIQQLEQIAAQLKTLSQTEKAVFLKFIATQAIEQRQRGRTKDADFLESLGNNLGLE